MRALLSYARENELQPPSELTLDGNPVTLGRHRDCEVILDTESVSRRHARIFFRGGSYTIEDLGSRNGTRVNGEPIDGEAPLHDGDVIAICDWQIRYAEAPTGINVTMIEGPLSGATIVSARDATRTDRPTRRIDPATALRAVLAVVRDLGSNLNIDELLPRLLDSVFDLYPNADHGVILLRQPSGEMAPMAMKSRRGTAKDLMISRSVVARVVERREAILSEDVSDDSAFEPSVSLQALPIRSLMCVPLMGREEEPLGVIELHTEVDGKPFTEGCLEMLTSVAMTAGIAVENAHLHEQAMVQDRLARDLDLAREVQRGFLPERVPSVPGYSFSTYYEAAQSIGGDYYGFVPLADGRLGIGVGDVAGKGLPAALMMARLSSEVRFAIAKHGDPGEALARINASFVESGMPDGRFVTFVLMVLDPERHVLSYANAGHPPPLLRRADGTVVPLQGGHLGVPLNVTDEPTLQAQSGSVELAPGEAVLLYTDGLSETMDRSGNLLDDEGIIERFAAARGDLDAVVAHIIDEMHAFGDEMRSRDDTTILCLGRDTDA